VSVLGALCVHVITHFLYVRILNANDVMLFYSILKVTAEKNNN
jgi:hypothetical protein